MAIIGKVVDYSLTPAQKETYEWICQSLKEEGRSPTIREIMRGLGLKSTAPVQQRLYQLRSKGYIDWEDGQYRTIKVMEMASVAMDAEVSELLAAFKVHCQATGQDFARSLRDRLVAVN